jgi:hypothetical protein
MKEHFLKLSSCSMKEHIQIRQMVHWLFDLSWLYNRHDEMLISYKVINKCCCYLVQWTLTEGWSSCVTWKYKCYWVFPVVFMESQILSWDRHKIVFDEDFLMHSLRKSLSDTYMILLCNYYFFWHKMGGIKKFELFRFSSDFKAVVCKVFICMSYWWNRFFFLLLYFKRGLKWAQIPKFAYLKGT